MPEAFCGFETVRKKVLLNLWDLWEKKLPSESQALFLTWRVCSISHRFTQKNRTHSIPQRPCGRQISQNLTAIFSSNALWTLYAEGVLWTRNRALKTSVTSVRSVRDKTPQRFFCVSSHNVGAFYFSQIYTEEQNSQRPTETLSQPISQNLIANFS